jgi:hypothetical protein
MSLVEVKRGKYRSATSATGSRPDLPYLESVWKHRNRTPCHNPAVAVSPNHPEWAVEMGPMVSLHAANRACE